jgi:hypothetical protein
VDAADKGVAMSIKLIFADGRVIDRSSHCF